MEKYTIVRITIVLINQNVRINLILVSIVLETAEEKQTRFDTLLLMPFCFQNVCMSLKTGCVMDILLKTLIIRWPSFSEDILLTLHAVQYTRKNRGE